MSNTQDDYYLAGYLDAFSSVKWKKNKFSILTKSECPNHAKLLFNLTFANTIKFKKGSYLIGIPKIKAIELLKRIGHLLIEKQEWLKIHGLDKFLAQPLEKYQGNADYFAGYIEGRHGFVLSRQVSIRVTNKNELALERIHNFFAPSKRRIYYKPSTFLLFRGQDIKSIRPLPFRNELFKKRLEFAIDYLDNDNLESKEKYFQSLDVIVNESIFTNHLNGDETHAAKIERIEARKRFKRELQETKIRAHKEKVEARKLMVAERKAKRLAKVEKRKQDTKDEILRMIASPTKQCKACNKVLPKSDFSSAPNNYDGKHSHCKICYKIRTNTKYRPAARRYYLKNRRKAIAYTRNWIKNNRSKYNAYMRQRMKLPFMRIRGNLKTRLKNALATVNKRKQEVFKVYLGCSNKELAHHIEKQFLPGMTWDNYGLFGWHIDHIIPISKFDMNDQNQVMKCSHYTNLRPLWAKDNLIKGARVISATNLDPISLFAGTAPGINIKCDKFLGSSLDQK